MSDATVVRWLAVFEGVFDATDPDLVFGWFLQYDYTYRKVEARLILRRLWRTRPARLLTVILVAYTLHVCPPPRLVYLVMPFLPSKLHQRPVDVLAQLHLGFTYGEVVTRENRSSVPVAALVGRSSVLDPVPFCCARPGSVPD